MSALIRFIGVLFIFIWVSMTFLRIDLREFFPNGDYSVYIDDFMNFKWLLLVIGVVLYVIGKLTKVKKQSEKTRNDRNNIYRNVNTSYENPNSKIIRKNFAEEQHQHKVEQFINRQQGKLKELALKVDWTPLKSGGSNFKTTTLKRVSSTRLETKKSKGGFAFGGIFALVGLGVLFGMSYAIFQEDGLTWELLFPILFGSVFAAAGFGMIIWPRPRIFDSRRGWFWAGNKSLLREQDFISLKKSARLSDIAAIQVLSERCSGNKGSSYSSWEINLISNEGQRLNVMDHGDKASILEDAQHLGEFLNVPVWENS